MDALRTLGLALLLSAACLCAAQDGKPQRVALVIGNGKYAEAPLPNAINDAADMAKELAAAGFTVIQRQDATVKEMSLALREFGDKLGKSATGVFYFAGHGMQVRGRNYLLPVDADIAREDEVQFSAMDLAAVMEKLDTARNPVNLVILDACRNNPFGKRFTVAAQGLAQVDAPPGTLIAFSTAPGSVAADGTGRNGLYTRHLLEEMRKPGTPIEETFKMVRAAVRKESAGRQIPWESTSLETYFAFYKPPPRPADKPVTVAVAASPQNSPHRGMAPPGAPPNFVAGDTWTYRVRNLADQSERPITTSVREVRASEVLWQADQASDLLGNFTRSKRPDGIHTFKPSVQMYVFPLNPGARFTLTAEQTTATHRIYDMVVDLSVVGEEEVTTLAGKFRTVKIDRKVKWVQRDKPANDGLDSWTYWYSASAKRFVLAQHANVTSTGKQLQNERWELESYRVK